MAKPTSSFREFCLYFMIIDDYDKSLIADKDKMSEISNALSSLFGSKNSNFAFKCDHCKTDEVYQHDSSIRLNNTPLAEINSVGKDTANSFFFGMTINNTNTAAEKNTNTGADNPEQVGSTPSSTIKSHDVTSGTDSIAAESGDSNTNTHSANVHSSDFNAEMKNSHY
ncbi:hypothetical protein EON73_02705, partial [bacterium]